MKERTLGILDDDAGVSEDKVRYSPRQLEAHFSERTPSAPIDKVVQLVPYSGTESRADQPAKITTVAGAMATRLS